MDRLDPLVMFGISSLYYLGYVFDGVEGFIVRV